MHGLICCDLIHDGVKTGPHGATHLASRVVALGHIATGKVRQQDGSPCHMSDGNWLWIKRMLHVCLPKTRICRVFQMPVSMVCYPSTHTFCSDLDMYGEKCFTAGTMDRASTSHGNHAVWLGRSFALK